MSTADTTTHDYTTGDPRRHHSLYLDDGNFVMQVENAIFKVHRSVLAKYSNFIRDMLNAPQESGSTEATDENPLVLTGDSVSGWELLLGTQYDRSVRFLCHSGPESYYGSNGPSFLDPEVFSRERVLAILPVAHKYCMEAVEGAILKQLKRASTTAENVDLVVAAQIVSSDALYQQGLKALISYKQKPDLAQAKRIGIEAHYSIMTAALSDMNAKDATLANVRAALYKAQDDLTKVDNNKCRHCLAYNNWKCTNVGCRRTQV